MNMWRKFTTWLQTNNRGMKMLAVFLVVGAAFAASKPALAIIPDGKEIAGAVAEIIFYFVGVFGNLIVAVVGTIIDVAQYTGFTNAPAVLKGWTIVRDVTNMFFIVIMLYIAFRTMFGQEANWQSSLIRLLIAAIVINFSRTICGLIIDASQVVMITFVNGMKDAAGGNFIDMLQLRQILQQPATTGSDVFFFSVLALIMSFCSLVIITLLLVFLVVRIVFLWILIILSPLAFFLKLSPIGGDMWGKWWGRFKEQVLTGPILAFFLWLSLLTTQETNNDVLAHGIPAGASSDTLIVPVLGNVNLQGYIVGLAMLVVSMMAARSVGGETFNIADKYAGFNSKFVGKVKSGGKALGLGALGVGGRLLDRTGSLVTGGRYRWSDLGVKAYKGIAKPAIKSVSNTLGLSEEAKMKDQIASYNRRGQHHEAEELQKKLNEKLTHDLGDKYKPDELASKVASGKFKDFEAAAALSIMAGKGHWSLKGKGAGISDIAEHAGLSAEQEYAIREKLEKSGDKHAWLGYDKDKQERLSADERKTSAEGSISKAIKDLDETKINDIFRGVSKGVHAGLDGKANQAHAAFALQSLDADAFNKLNQGTKNEVLDAMKVEAAKNPGSANSVAMQQKIMQLTEEMTAPLVMQRDKATDPNARANIQKKIDAIEKRHLGLNGGTDPVLQGGEALASATKKLGEERLKILKRGGELSHAIPGAGKGGSLTPAAQEIFTQVMSNSKMRADVVMNMSPADIKGQAGEIIRQTMSLADMESVASHGNAEQYFAVEKLMKNVPESNPDYAQIKAAMSNANSDLRKAANNLETKVGAWAKGAAIGAGAITVSMVSGGALAGVAGTVAGAMFAGGTAGRGVENLRSKMGGGGH